MAAIQAVVAPEMQGRVFTLMTSVSGAMSPLGLIIAGPVADKLGVQTWFIIGGVVTFMMGVAGFFIPAALNLEQGRPEKKGTASEAAASNLAPAPGDGD
jgi:DHA3 family macrolide efflux protein-like MFS transporter